MKSSWAEENLQTIRTLMERSAVYRRALGPILLFAGALGVLVAAAGLLLQMDSLRAFDALWLGAAVIAVGGAFIIARRQALKDAEPFWSPPTRRVAQALLPPLAAGGVTSALFLFTVNDDLFAPLLAFFWILFYGCAIHAAGFFMPRGMKLLGWIFIAGISGFFLVLFITHKSFGFSAHWLMGAFFGVLHLIYGAYLYLTERKHPVA